MIDRSKRFQHLIKNRKKNIIKQSYIKNIFIKIYITFIIMLILTFTITLKITNSHLRYEISSSSKLSSDIFKEQLSDIFTQINNSYITLITSPSFIDRQFLKTQVNPYKQYLYYIECIKTLIHTISLSNYVDSIAVYIPDDVYYANSKNYFYPLSTIINSSKLNRIWDVGYSPISNIEKCIIYRQPIYDFSNPNKLLYVIEIYSNLEHINKSAILFNNFKEPLLQIKQNDTLIFSLNNIENLSHYYENSNYYISSFIEPKSNFTIYFGFSIKDKLDKLRTMYKTFIAITFIAVIIGLILYFAIYKSSNNRVYHTLSLIDNFTSLDNRSIITTPKNEFDYIDKAIYELKNNITSLMDEKIEDQVKIRKLELKALRNSIDPHFLYNALDSINWISINSNSPQISCMVRSLASFYKLTLNNGNDLISIKDQLKQIEEYLKIQFSRYNGFTYEILCEENIKEVLIPNMLFQPIVENSLIHGIFKLDTDNGLLNINAYSKNNTLYIDFIDNGPGFDKNILNSRINEIKSTNHGYGLKNVNERIQLFSTPESGIKFIPCESGAHVRLVIFD